MTADEVPLLRVRALTKRYATARGVWRRRAAADVCTVHDVSFDVARGEVFGIIGESGSGKTTVARMLLRLIEPTSGTVALDGREIQGLGEEAVRDYVRPRMRMIFQDPDAALNPAYPVGEGLARAILLHDAKARALSSSDVDARVVAQLEAVGLGAAYAGKFPDQLSGGEKRRLGVCRALATNPSLIVADEPLSGLDVVLQEHVLSLLLEEQHTRRFGLVLVSHDLDRVQQVCDRAMVMLGGRVMELLPVSRASSAAHDGYRHPYSVALQSAHDRVSGGAASMQSEGFPTVGDLPVMQRAGADGVGCVWAGRCARQAARHAPAACIEQSPILREVAPGHLVACHFADDVMSAPSSAAPDRVLAPVPEPVSAPGPALARSKPGGRRARK